jgi:2-dehydropantoate 2-reductase
MQPRNPLNQQSGRSARKQLAFLAPLALATTALDAPLGGVRTNELYLRCQHEVLAVARAEGAQIDEDTLRALVEGAPDTMQSSMHKNVAAGRLPELDAIAGPILRAGKRHRIPVPATTKLARLVETRQESSSKTRLE